MKKEGFNEVILELLKDDFIQTFNTDYFKIKYNRDVYGHHNYINEKRVFKLEKTT